MREKQRTVRGVWQRKTFVADVPAITQFESKADNVTMNVACFTTDAGPMWHYTWFEQHGWRRLRTWIRTAVRWLVSRMR